MLVSWLVVLAWNTIRILNENYQEYTLYGYSVDPEQLSFVDRLLTKSKNERPVSIKGCFMRILLEFLIL